MNYLLITVLMFTNSLCMAMAEKSTLQTPLPTDVRDVPVIRNGLLNLSKRNLRNCIDLESFANDHVVSLDLSGNHIWRFDMRELLRIFPALRSLDCSANELSSLRRAMVEGMPSGFILNLSGNKIVRIGRGVEQVFALLRDRGITIYCDNTLLPEEQLIQLAQQIEGMSRRRCCKTVARTVGSWGLLVASCGCAITRGVLLENAQLPLWGNIGLFSGFFALLAGSIACTIADSFADCLVADDARPNKLSWENC